MKNPGILWCGRRVGRGPSEALESAEIGRSVRHASGTPLCETGAADLKGLRPTRRPSCVHWTGQFPKMTLTDVRSQKMEPRGDEQIGKVSQREPKG